MNFSRLLIYVILIFFGVLAIYLFISNNNLLDKYDLKRSREITGKIKSFEKSRGYKHKTYFHIKLENYDNTFVVPSPEFSSFSYKVFKKFVKKGDTLKLLIEPDQPLNFQPININQIIYKGKEFIDFENKVHKRKIEKWLSLLFAILSIVGLFHHHKHPWL